MLLSKNNVLRVDVGPVGDEDVEEFMISLPAGQVHGTILVRLL